MCNCTSEVRCCASPRNDGGLLLPVHDLALVPIELHAAERATLVEIADRIGWQFGLLGHRMLAKVFSPAGRAIAEVVGAVIIKPRALVVRYAIEDLEMDVGMVEPDPAQLHHIF